MMAHKKSLKLFFEGGRYPDSAFFIDRVLKDKKIIVYGAGESFHYFKEIVMRRYGYIPSVVLDNKFVERDSFECIPAFSPLEYQPSEDEKEHGLVIVCLGNQSYYGEAVQVLQRMGFRNIMALMDIYEIHNPFNLPQELETEGFQYYVGRRARIESCIDILADDLSRDVFIACLRTHMQRKPVSIPMCNRSEQYVPKDVPLSRGYARFLYCGVSVGEMAHVISLVGKVDELVCFEPDPNQFRLTAKYLSQNCENIAGRITALPCALYSHEAIKPFTYSDTSFGSRIMESAEAVIQCVSIDHALPNFHPTFINMDIEGAELEALKGAEKTIRESRPDLAICVYHSPQHLWEIPLYLHELNLGYRFYLRNYTGFVSETVLYAVS